MTLPTVSIIVPAYNASSTLAEALLSLTAQRPPPDEIIVVDDGSTDDIRNIVSEFGCVYVRHESNRGVGAALNSGLSIALGDMFAFLDSDDLRSVGSLPTQIDALLRSSEAAIVGRVQEFVCQSLPQEVACRFQPRPVQTGWLSGATLALREVFDKVGPFDEALRTSTWVDWMGRAKSEGVVFAEFPEVVLLRRLRPGSLSYSPTRHRDLVRVARAALERRRAI